MCNRPHGVTSQNLLTTCKGIFLIGEIIVVYSKWLRSEGRNTTSIYLQVLPDKEADEMKHLGVFVGCSGQTDQINEDIWREVCIVL
jgi:hypothetical protein